MCHFGAVAPEEPESECVCRTICARVIRDRVRRPIHHSHHFDLTTNKVGCTRTGRCRQAVPALGVNIHRDIKPANVLLQEGKPVMSDFGISLAVGVAGGGRLTETGLSLGTPHYMSPEQATGDRDVNARWMSTRSGAFSTRCSPGSRPSRHPRPRRCWSRSSRPMRRRSPVSAGRCLLTSAAQSLGRWRSYQPTASRARQSSLLLWLTRAPPTNLAPPQPDRL